MGRPLKTPPTSIISKNVSTPRQQPTNPLAAIMPDPLGFPASVHQVWEEHQGNLSTLECVVLWCERRGVDPADLGTVVKRCPDLRDALYNDGKALNLIRKERENAGVGSEEFRGENI